MVQKGLELAFWNAFCGTFSQLNSRMGGTPHHLNKKIRWAVFGGFPIRRVKKIRSFYGQADLKGRGGVSPFGPDCMLWLSPQSYIFAARMSVFDEWVNWQREFLFCPSQVTKPSSPASANIGDTFHTFFTYNLLGVPDDYLLTLHLPLHNNDSNTYSGS